ncbi:redox-sensitive transcriptional activator SoxR [Paeniglutamicibacter gangotriensis]|uniref:Redox-sensitive transcriptional activator soxR n=2 Tax=Paeniglutamicibacter gangotriensis TaxID=254787 RepID=M7ML83_9MICC|nr:redox-sensitive transcriptional activator SoxR [Paeniglutamicibacter gangotriensis]EMQ97097.1 Redox-sensitive transcriptional activator soxR [Paeniglutamicibacter gangotriensis Lz1y]
MEPMDMGETAAQDLSVGQVAARSGVAVSALHYYEREGLISSWRTSGNQRRFDRSVLRRVAVIRAAQRAGIPLASIAEIFAGLPDDQTPLKEDWQAVSAAWRDDLQERIHQLQSLRDGLGGCIGCGCLSLAECGFVNPNDQLADERGGAKLFRDSL